MLRTTEPNSWWKSSCLQIWKFCSHLLCKLRHPSWFHIWNLCCLISCGDLEILLGSIFGSLCPISSGNLETSLLVLDLKALFPIPFWNFTIDQFHQWWWVLLQKGKEQQKDFGWLWWKEENGRGCPTHEGRRTATCLFGFVLGLVLRFCSCVLLFAGVLKNDGGNASIILNVSLERH